MAVSGRFPPLRRGASTVAGALVALLAAGLLAAGCGGDDDQARTTPTDQTATEQTTPTQTTDERTKSCTNEQDGFSVERPADWHTNSGDGVPSCTFFHPERFQLRQGTEALDIAILIKREPVAFSEVTGEDPGTRVVEREEIEIDGRRAVRREIEGTGDALIPEGTRGYQYLVDLDEQSIVATTYDIADLDFERNREVLDSMMESFELTR